MHPHRGWWSMFPCFSNMVCHLPPCRLGVSSALLSRWKLFFVLAWTCSLSTGHTKPALSLPRWRVLVSELARAHTGTQGGKCSSSPIGRKQEKSVTSQAACWAASVKRCGGWKSWQAFAPTFHFCVSDDPLNSAGIKDNYLDII